MYLIKTTTISNDKIDEINTFIDGDSYNDISSAKEITELTANTYENLRKNGKIDGYRINLYELDSAEISLIGLTKVKFKKQKGKKPIA